MSSVYKSIVVPPEKVTSINNEFAKMFEGGGAVKDKANVSAIASSRNTAPAFKSPASRVVYKASPVAKLVAAMRQKKTFEELEQIMSPGSSSARQAVRKDRTNPPAPDLQNGSLPVQGTGEDKENMSRPTSEVDKSASDVQQSRSKEAQKEPLQDSAAPKDAGSKPTPKDAGSKPTPKDAGSKPTPKDAGSKPTPKDAGSKPTGGRERQTAGARKQKVMNWLQSHDEEMLLQHDPDDLIVSPPSTERAPDAGFSSQLGDDNTASTNKFQEDDSMDDRESDDDTIKMNDTDGTIEEADENGHQEHLRTKDTNLKENEEDMDGEIVEEKTLDEDRHDNMSEDDMDEEEEQEMDQPPNDRLSQSSQSIAWADNIDNVSVDTTDTSRQEKPAAPNPKKDTAVKPFKEHILYDWFIKPMRKSTDIVVEGHRKQDPEHQYWHSTAIVKRVTSRMVVTGSGTVYRLRGFIDRSMVLEQGFHAKVARAFKMGFPENWKEVLEDIDNSTSEKQGQSQGQRNTNKHKVHCKVRESLPSTRAVPDIPQHSVQNVLGSLGRSRSGRVVKPRMAWWANQRVVIEKDNVKIHCTSSDELAMSPAFLSFRTVKGLIVHRDDLEDSRSGTPGTVKRRPASTVRRAAKTAVEDAPRTDPRVPRDRSNQCEPDTTLLTVKKTPRLDAQKDTVIRTDIVLDTPGAPKGREALSNVQNSRLRRNARNKKPQGIPEDILSTPKPTDPFKKSKSREEDIRDQSSAHKSGQISNQKEPKTQEPPQCESEDKRKGKIAEGKQRRGRSRKDGGNKGASVEQQPSTEKQVPTRGGARRGRPRKEDSTSNVQTAKEVVVTTTKKRGRPSKKESLTVNGGRSETNEKMEAPSKHKNLTEDEESQAEETEKGERPRRGRGRKRAQSSASRDTSRRSQRIKNGAEGSMEESEEEPTMRQGGNRMGLRNTKKSKVAHNNSSAEEQAKGMPDNTETEREESEAPKNPGKRKRRYQRKKRAGNKKIEETETSTTEQEDEATDKCESTQDTNKSQRKTDKKSSEDCKGRQGKEQGRDASETSWTLEEEKKLYSAINSTSAEDECMWQKVAVMVGTHTAQDCQARYQEMTSTSTTKQTASAKDKGEANGAEKGVEPSLTRQLMYMYVCLYLEPKKPVVVTGKAGTLKRKRQIQELLKQHNEGHEDEAFEDGITPFKKQRKISKGLISIDYNADEDDDVRTDVATRQAFQTPMSRLFGHSSAAAEPTPKGLSLRTPGAISEEVHK
uniref:Myb-like domain-containing protein n=1 Tax=Branchiostoma floridae TaxID=7739 RepID=C3Z296_BRAFL|eukprot:XP_002597135.1 hypothetical protein BRAFLDRAFT_121299 [Branchiostoma floridae]